MEQAVDISVYMVRPHMDNIPQVPFADGFGIRPFKPGEGVLWTDIQLDTERLFPIGDELFMREFGHDLEATLRRCFIVTNPHGAAAGTISAWYSPDYKGQDHGQIHWVAIRPAYQGHGLGKAAMSYALSQLALWHERAMLGTSTGRIPAIKMYLNFGFVPDLDHPDAREAWAMVREQLKHPTLEGLDLG